MVVAAEVPMPNLQQTPESAFWRLLSSDLPSMAFFDTPSKFLFAAPVKATSVEDHRLNYQQLMSSYNNLPAYVVSGSTRCRLHTLQVKDWTMLPDLKLANVVPHESFFTVAARFYFPGKSLPRSPYWPHGLCSMPLAVTSTVHVQI